MTALRAETSRGRPFASPLSRRLAALAGVDLGQLKGSGPGGRIVKADIEAAVSGGAPKPAAVSTPMPAAPVARAEMPGLPAYDEFPNSNVRKVVARRLAESKQQAPHFYLSIDCEIDALLKLREQINASAPKDKEGKVAWKVSVNDMVIKALALALVRVPDANVTWTETAMLKHHHADVGVAVALPGNGLITPIIRHADTVTLSGIALAMKDFAARAKSRKLKRHHGRLQSRYVRHQGFHRRDQSSPFHHSGGGCG